MNETITTMIISGVQQLQESITTIAPEVWRILLTQQRVIAIQLIVGLLVSIIAGIGGYKLLKYDIKENNSDALFSMFGIMIMIASIIGIIVISINLPSYLINPEYHAIKEIAQMFI